MHKHHKHEGHLAKAKAATTKKLTAAQEAQGLKKTVNELDRGYTAKEWEVIEGQK